MHALMSLVVAGLIAAGLYLMLQRGLLHILVGLTLLGHGANMGIFVAAGARIAPPPLVPEGALVPPAGHADPLPQALILTAIVIGFGVLGFALALARRAVETLGTDDLDALPDPGAEPPPPDAEEAGR